MGYPGVRALWDLLNVDYAGLDLITGVKSLFPHFNVNWKSLVPEKQHELNHVAVEIDVITAVTAIEDDVASSTAASSSLTPPASQTQKHKRQPLLPGRHGPHSVQGVPTPFSETAPQIFQVSWSSRYRSFTADWLHPATWEVRGSNCCHGSIVKTQDKLSLS